MSRIGTRAARGWHPAPAITLEGEVGTDLRRVLLTRVLWLEGVPLRKACGLLLRSVRLVAKTAHMPQASLRATPLLRLRAHVPRAPSTLVRGHAGVSLLRQWAGSDR